MSDETTVGREPIQIVEIEQPGCVNLYGDYPSGVCEAALGETGTRKCFNTRSSCQDSDNYDGSGTIYWRFAKPAAVMPRNLYDVSAGVYIKTNPIPTLVKLTTVPTRINVGGGDKNSSPLGQRSLVAITLQDHPWDDSIGDFYVTERPTGDAGEQYTPIERGTFWTKWLARNPYHTRYTVNVYDGYLGQSLGNMQKRTYILERVDGPANDLVTLTAKDPLRLADDKRTLFPAVSDVVLITSGGITDTQTSSIELSCVEAELTADYGNTGSTRYLRIEDEILSYTGYASSGTNEWTLSGVTRGVLGTTNAAHDEDEKCQRVGRYDSLEVWEIAEDLLLEHTSIDSDFIDSSAWDTEGNAYLSPFTLSGTVEEPTPVIDLLGELTEQCPFYLWWDEREQTIPIKAIRPPIGETVEQLNDDAHIIRDSAVVREDHDQRISRVFLYYNRKDPTKGIKDVANYSSVRSRIDGDAESDEQHGDVRIRQIFSRWLTTSPQAIQTTTRLLARLRDAVQILSVKVDAKDRDIATSDVLEITTRNVTDETGAAIPRLWQVIAANEIMPGETVLYDCQKFEYYGRFWIFASESAPDYDAASDAEKEANAYFADANGAVGTANDYGYQWV